MTFFTRKKKPTRKHKLLAKMPLLHPTTKCININIVGSYYSKLIPKPDP